MIQRSAEQEELFSVELPYPPTVNHYWRHVGARTLLSRQGRAYRRDVAAAVLGARGRPRLPLTGRLRVALAVWPPDRRRRDLDNVLKAVLDALQHAGVYPDDSLIEELSIARKTRTPGGRVEVVIQQKATQSYTRYGVWQRIA